MGLLDTLSGDKRFHVSSKLTEELADTIYTNLKTVTESTAGSMFEVNTKAKWDEIVGLIPAWPLGSKYWYIKIDAVGIRLNERNVKELIKPFTLVDTSYIWIDCVNYGQQKLVVEYLKSEGIAYNSMYFNRLKYEEIEFILGKYASVLGQRLTRYLYQEYRDDVGAPYKIRELLESDRKIENTRQILGFLGVSDKNIRGLAFRLLGVNRHSSRPNITTRKINQSVAGYLDTLGPTNLRRYLLSEVKSILHVKMLYQAGQIIDSIPLEYMFTFPELFYFDGKAAQTLIEGLYSDSDAVVNIHTKVEAVRESKEVNPRSKYRAWEITKISELGYKRIQRLVVMLTGGPSKYEWYNSIDALGFVSQWVSQEYDENSGMIGVTPQISSLRLGA